MIITGMIEIQAKDLGLNNITQEYETEFTWRDQKLITRIAALGHGKLNVQNLRWQNDQIELRQWLDLTEIRYY